MAGSRTRLANAIAAVALAVGLAIWLVSRAPADRTLWAVLGVIATVLVAGACVGGRDRPARLGLVVLAGAYTAVLLQRRAGLAASAPVFGAALFACGELAALAAALRGARVDGSISVRRALAQIVAVALAGLLAGGLVLAVAGALAPARSLALTLAGALAAAALIWLLALLARRVR
jgi:hypothetical protein